jgi:prepilin-type N-terminal cleavage/methylation domain-containing protein
MPESLEVQFARVRRQAKLDQSGMTMLELMIAITVLAIGMLGATGMILAGVQANSRNKNDTTAVVLDQEILEQFATYKNYPSNGFVLVNDCGTGATAQHQASVVGVVGGSAGATTYTAPTAPLPANVGDINWTAAAPAFATNLATGYAMNYLACNGDLYEVRWNITEINSQLSELTVSSRQTAAANTRASILFAVPTSLHTLIDN